MKTQTRKLSPERQEELDNFRKKYSRFFEATLLGMLAGRVPRRFLPSLEFTLEEECYTDHAKISIGLNQKKYTTEERLFAFIMYVLGHEAQHILSTTQKPWMWGINTAIKNVIMYIGKMYGYKPGNIAGEKNLRQFIARMQKDGHVVPSYDTIAQFCHFVCNATEDGRIERHRSGELPGYIRPVRVHRGEMWMDNVEVEPENGIPTPSEKLSLYCNEVLSLATCHVYGRNFWAIYAGTPEADMVDRIRKHVTKAVYSRKCKQCMTECIEIVNLLTPTFFEAFISDPMNEFMQMLQQLLEQIMNAHGEEGFSEQRESNEEAATGNGKSPFGTSVLGKPATDENGEITGEIADEGNGIPAGDANGPGESKGVPDFSNGKKAGSNQAGTAGTCTFDLDAIEKAMRDAAAAISSDFSASAGNMRNHSEESRRNVSKPESNATSIAKRENIKFRELQRAYTVDIPLPYVIEQQGEVLRDAIQHVFKPKRTGKYKERTSGDIDVDRLFALAMNELDVFDADKKPDNFSGCCYILQDNSGSMGSGRNSKRMFASEATARIEYAFRDFMPLKIVAFDESGEVIHEVIKNWDDNFVHSCSYNFFHKGRSGGCNADYHDIVIATAELLERSEKEKILIVISDGLPCGSQGVSSPQDAVRMAVEEARASGIKVVGIYVDDVVRDADRAAYEAMYGASCVFTDTDHIAEELTTVMTSWAHV